MIFLLLAGFLLALKFKAFRPFRSAANEAGLVLGHIYDMSFRRYNDFADPVALQVRGSKAGLDIRKRAPFRRIRDLLQLPHKSDLAPGLDRNKAGVPLEHG